MVLIVNNQQSPLSRRHRDRARFRLVIGDVHQTGKLLQQLLPVVAQRELTVGLGAVGNFDFFIERRDPGGDVINLIDRIRYGTVFRH